MKRAPVLGVALLCALSCGYYNGMWSANRFASQARRLEHEGRGEDARASWAQAALKAESVVVHHPHSRWSDDALVLQGEGLAKSGACDRAAVPLARALATVTDTALSSRAALAAAECDLARNDPRAAERHLRPVTHDGDRQRASRAAFIMGRAADQRGDARGAAAWYGRSLEREAGPARALALLAAADTEAALALLDTLSERRVDESVWTTLLARVDSALGTDRASAVLDRVLAHGHLRAGARAKLELEDGDRLFARGDVARAEARYTRVAAAVPDSVEGKRARVRLVRTALTRTTNRADLAGVKGRLDRLVASGVDGPAAAEARTLALLMRPILDPDPAGDAAPFHAAEIARDSLGAPLLAADVLLAFARAHPASFFAPKAAIAAAMLTPDRHDSLLDRVRGAFPSSPYVLALDGDPGPAYAALEDSLGRALGVEVEPVLAFVVSRVAPPVPGARGPTLDETGTAGEPPRLAPRRRPTADDERPPQRKRRAPDLPVEPGTPPPLERP